jgi:hypothetical protein
MSNPVLSSTRREWNPTRIWIFLFLLLADILVLAMFLRNWNEGVSDLVLAVASYGIGITLVAALSRDWITRSLKAGGLLR